MFRVLSEEEASKVTRWQAPDLSDTEAPIARTRQLATPVPAVDAQHTSAPQLQAAHTLVAPVPDRATPQTANIPLPNPSADMLQTSYDDGYARGYAEGNAALHQQSVKQLQVLIKALDTPALPLSDAELEQEVLALSVDIARLLVRRELTVEPAALASLVQAGLEQLPHAGLGTAIVHMHPLDANIVRELMDTTDSLQVVDDCQLGSGECRIECGASTVNCGVEDWLGALAARLGIVSAAATDASQT